MDDGLMIWVKTQMTKFLLDRLQNLLNSNDHYKSTQQK